MKQKNPLALVHAEGRPSQTQAIETLVNTASFYLVNQIPSDWADHKKSQPYHARMVYGTQRAIVSLGRQQLFNQSVQLLDRADLLIGNKIPVDPQ